MCPCETETDHQTMDEPPFCHNPGQFVAKKKGVLTRVQGQIDLKYPSVTHTQHTHRWGQWGWPPAHTFQPISESTWVWEWKQSCKMKWNKKYGTWEQTIPSQGFILISSLLRQLGYLVKWMCTVASHQVNRRPVVSDLSVQPGTESPSSSRSPCPVRFCKQRPLTHSRSWGDQIGFTNTYLPQSSATGLPPRRGWNGYSNLQQPCRGHREQGGGERGALSGDQVTLW